MFKGLIGISAPKRPPKRIRDFQRSRVYRWERVYVHGDVSRKPLSLADCRELVLEVYLWHEKPANSQNWSPPEVTDGRGRRHACGSRDVIKLPRWARHRTIVLHECAHGMAADGHGPIFMAKYLALLGNFTEFNSAELLESALSAGIKVQI